MIPINANLRQDDLLNKTADFNIQRIVSIALPFLALHSKTAAFTSIGIGCYQCYTLWNTPSDNRATPGKRWAHGALSASYVALGYFFPAQHFFISNGILLTKHLYKLALTDTSWKDRSKTTLTIIHQALYFLSIHNKTPGFIVLSLLSQAISELYQAYNYDRANEKPEIFAKFFLALIRIHKASFYLPHAFLPKVAQMPFRELLEGDEAFYKQPNYLATTQKELSQDKPLPVTYKWDNPDAEALHLPFGLNYLHALVGRLILPASSLRLTGLAVAYAQKIREAVPLDSEWKYKRITIGVSGNKIDAMIFGKISTLNNRTWVLASNGNGEFYEDKLYRSNDFKELLNEVNGNALVFNYPGVGASTGLPNRFEMAKTYRAMLSFLEDQESGIGAERIIGYGHSIGGGVQGDALRNYSLNDRIQYVFVKSRTFSDLSAIASILTNKLFGLLIKVLGWDLGSVESSKALKAPEIVLQTAKVHSYEELQNSSKIAYDGVIPAEASLGKALLDDSSYSKNNKVFLGIRELHNAPLKNVPFLAQLIKSFFTNQQKAG